MTEQELVPADGMSRRTIIKAGAWSLPVIALATAAPMAAAASGGEPVWGGWFNNAIRNEIPEKFAQPFKGYLENGTEHSDNTPQTLNIHTVVLLDEIGADVTVTDVQASVPAESGFTIGSDPVWNSQVVTPDQEAFWGTPVPGSGYQIQVNNITPSQFPIPPDNDNIWVEVLVTLSNNKTIPTGFAIAYQSGR